MHFSRIILKNWRNFEATDVRLNNRVFLVGPNASGKSNFLDSIRFLSDLARLGGGLQNAIAQRGGIGKIRSLSGREKATVEIDVEITNSTQNIVLWRYAIAFKQETSKRPKADMAMGASRSIIEYERVWKGSEKILDRPDESDRRDPLRLTQTHLEQINDNFAFRDVADFFRSVLYLHLVPQFLRHQQTAAMEGQDPFGCCFMDRIAATPARTRTQRLKKIEEALQKIVPQLKSLKFTHDDRGRPHLELTSEHWRRKAAVQREDEFSDGTLRLIVLFWSLLESDSVLLLEEPEISLSAAVVERLPLLIHRILMRRRRQIILSTHSDRLLSERGIGGDEVLLLIPTRKGTRVEQVSDKDDMRALLEAGMSVGEVTLPSAAPDGVEQLDWIEELTK